MKQIAAALTKFWKFLNFVLDEVDYIQKNTTYGNKF